MFNYNFKLSHCHNAPTLLYITLGYKIHDIGIIYPFESFDANISPHDTFYHDTWQIYL